MFKHNFLANFTNVYPNDCERAKLSELNKLTTTTIRKYNCLTVSANIVRIKKSA